MPAIRFPLGRIATFVLACLAIATPLRAQTPIRIDPESCWRFALASERATRPVGAVIPPLAMLTDTPFPSSSRWAVRRLDERGRALDVGARLPLSTWYRPAGTDSVQVWFSEGLAAYGFTLAYARPSDGARRDSLHGRAELWSDDGPSVHALGEAFAVRTSCPDANGVR